MRDMSRAEPEAAFQDVLADVGRSRARDDQGEERFANPAAGAAFAFVGRTWQATPAWPSEADFLEADEQPQAATEPSFSDDPEAIARELGLDQTLSERELDRARRQFMWRHHPDRCEESQRAQAGRCVAIANMLIDRARAQLASQRRY